jgi:hypothetical protein
VTRARVEIGRDVQAASETAEGVELVGRVRLLPGRAVEIVSRPFGTPLVRRALVHSWRVVQLGSGGPTYRGACRWE